MTTTETMGWCPTWITNQPAYLSGHVEDIMMYLYGDLVSEMACRVKRHAGHYQSQRGQGGGGGGGGEPDSI